MGKAALCAGPLSARCSWEVEVQQACQQNAQGERGKDEACKDGGVGAGQGVLPFAAIALQSGSARAAAWHLALELAAMSSRPPGVCVWPTT
jgi:hypothetical protein